MANRNLIVRAGFDASGFSRGVRQATNSLNGFSTTATSALSKVGKAALAFISIKAIAGFVKDCLSLGSALSEVQNVVDVTFGDAAEEINQFAKTSVTQFGISETACKRYTGTIGAMFKSMGISGKNVVSMSEKITALSADMASFYDINTDEAFAKIRSGISGETEPLKQLGINMSVANLQAYAMSQGITKAYSKMSQSEQTLLRYNYLLSVTKDAQGDFARTSNSWANQTRILSEQFNALKATLGQAFIQMLTPVLKALNMLMAKLQSVANYFNAFTEAAFGKQQAAQGAGMAKSTEDAANAMDSLGDATETAGNKAQKAVAGFDEVNTLTKSLGDTDFTGLDVAADEIKLNKLPDTKSTEKLQNSFNKLKKTVEETAKPFKDGFLPPVKDINLNSIISGLERIKKSLQDIASDTGLQTALGNVGTTFGNMLGKLTGNNIKIGANIADGLINGIADGFEAKKQSLISRLTDSFNNISRVNISLGNIFDFFGDISEVFTEANARSIWSSITQILLDTCSTGFDLATKIVADLVGGVENILTSNKQRLYVAFDNTLGVAAQVMGSVKDTVETTCQNILDTYDQKVTPAIEKISQAISDFGGTCLDAYNNHVTPAFSGIADSIDNSLKQHVQPLIDQTITLFGDLAESISDVMKYWEPLFEFLVNLFTPFLSTGFKAAMDMALDVINLLIDLINDLLAGLNGLLQFLTGVFTGDWNRAWKGIEATADAVSKSIEDTIHRSIDLIYHWVKGCVDEVQALIDGMKEALGLRNTASNDLSKFQEAFKANGNEERFKKKSASERQQWINRQKEIGGNMPEGAEEWIMNLPHYAKGGIINREQLAVLGEGGKQEAVIPLENSGFIDALAISVANAINAVNSNNSNTSGMLNAFINIDGREVARATVPYMNEEARRRGVRLNG